MYVKIILYSLLTYNLASESFYMPQEDNYERYDQWSKINTHDYEYGFILKHQNYLNASCYRHDATKAVYLKLINSSISTLNHTNFKSHPNFKGIFLSDAHINIISPGTFAELKDLMELDLSNNNLNQIEENVFNKVHNLTYLDLSNNNIKNVSQRSFAGLQKLSYLFLQGNKIPLLYNNQFESQATSLLTLNISSNRLTEINTTFRGLRRLTHLYLQMNNIASTGPDSFADLTSLQLLDLSHNSINTLTPDVFLKTEKLTHLYLQNNGIVLLFPYIFKSQEYSLTFLDLSSNSLYGIHYHLKGLRSLTHLYLQKNQISSMSSHSLGDLSSLEYLDISHNKLKKFVYGLFDPLVNLLSLNFSFNKFVTFPLEYLDYLTQLEELIIDSNLIRSLNGSKIFHHFPLLRKIGLSGNLQWSCTKLAKLIKELRMNHVDILKGHYFKGDNVRGISCYKEDLITSTEPAQNMSSEDRSKGNPKYTDENIEKLINIVLEKSGNANSLTTVLLTINTVVLITMACLQIFSVYKLNRGKTDEKHLELI